MKLTHSGKVDDDGVMTITNRRIFDSEVNAYFRGKEVKISVEQKTKKRSLDQNDFYNGIVLPIVTKGLRDLGWKAEHRTLHTTDVHEMFKDLFIPNRIINEKTGEVIETKGSTADLNTVPFMDFIADIQQWSAEHGIYVPDPIFEKKKRWRGNSNLKKTA